VTTPAARLLLLAAFALPLSACSKSGAGSGAQAEPEQVTITRIVVGYKGKGPKTNRTRDEALRLAKSILDDVRSGRRTLEELVVSMSEGNKDKQGSLTFGRGEPGSSDYALRQVAFATPVGALATEPLEIPEAGFMVFRRDR
jgi:hypothetical protein